MVNRYYESMVATLSLAPLPFNPVLVASCRRAYAAALKREERATNADAPIEKVCRLARDTEFALRRLEAALRGEPLPRPLTPRTARNMALGAFQALAKLGLAIARAVRRQASLVKARAALAAKRAAAPKRPLLARVRRFLANLPAVVVARLRPSPQLVRARLREQMDRFTARRDGDLYIG